MKTAIRSVSGYRIWDSRGRPTVEVEVTLANGDTGRGIAPAGASCGSNEAVDLRDAIITHGDIALHPSHPTRFCINRFALLEMNI